MKTCNQCHELKDESEFYFRSDTQRYQNKCKTCWSIASKHHYREHVEEVKLNVREYRTKNSTKIKARRAAQYAGNPFPARNRSKKWREENPEKHAKTNREWYEKNKDKVCISSKIWAMKNPEKTAARHRRWAQENPEKAAARRARHEALKRGAVISDFTNDDWDALLFIYDHRCAYCRKDEFEVGGLEKEHVIPLSRGGNHTVENIVPSCHSCNASKHNKTLEEWRS